MLQSPEEYVGHSVGADYKVARWKKIHGYFTHVSDASDRVLTRQIGTTTGGRPYIAAEISAPETLRQRQAHLADRRKVADPRLIDGDAEQQRLIREGQVVVYFGCSIHGDEIGATQMSMELLHELATSGSAEVAEILANVILVMIHSNDPDGLDANIDWYERSLGTPWEGSGMPWVYNTYAGNQNVWDTVHLNLAESRADAHLLYQEWYPNILCDIHQWGASSARLLVPPHSDPTNPNLHPLHNQLLHIIGGHMQADLIQAGKEGVRSGYQYSTYESGIPRYTASRHNMVGFLTEAASCRIATPLFLTHSQLDADHREVTTSNPQPWPGGWWRLRDIVEYEKIAYTAVLKTAARNRELFQRASIRMARDAIAKGQSEPPFAWLIPGDQRDPGTANHMLEILHRSGVEVHRAEEAFVADDVSHPAGTFIMLAAQPYRTYIKDLLERQDPPTASTPNRFEGWTLSLQMGVRCVTVDSPFECQAEKLDGISPPQGQIETGAHAAYVARAGANDDHRLINRLHREGVSFSFLTQGSDVPAGSLLIHDGEKARQTSPGLFEGLGVDLAAYTPSSAGRGDAPELARPVRTGVYRPWTDNLDEGWIRFVLEAAECPFSVVRNAGIRAGDLRDRYDCLIVPSMPVAALMEGRAAGTTEPRYVGGIGSEGVASLQQFVRAGGTLVCNDQACDLPIEQFGLPVVNVLKGLPHEEFLCRGSSLRVQVDTAHPVGYGMPEWASAYFYEAQAFGAAPVSGGEAAAEAHVVARYASTALVESGRIRAGEDLIAGKAAIVDVAYGAGHVVLLGFRVQRNGQTHGTFRFLYNALQRSTQGRGLQGDVDAH